MKRLALFLITACLCTGVMAADAIKAEGGKDQPEPTMWEQREYFDLF